MSFHYESYVHQIVPSQCLAQPMAMSLAIVRSWGEQAVSIMGQNSRYCMVCLMPQSPVSCLLENPHFNMFTLDRPTCVRNRLSAFQVVQGFSAPGGRFSSALMLRCTLVSRARVVPSIAPSGQLGGETMSTTSNAHSLHSLAARDVYTKRGLSQWNGGQDCQ